MNGNSLLYYKELLSWYKLLEQIYYFFYYNVLLVIKLFAPIVSTINRYGNCKV